MERNEYEISPVWWVNPASVDNQSQKERERKKAADNEKKLKKKERVKNAITFLVLASMAVTYATPRVINAIKNEKELRKANKYMDNAMDFIAEDLDRAVLSNGDVVLFSKDADSLRKIADELEVEFGISRDCAIYCISEKYGNEAFDKVVTTYGYNNSEEFLRSRYPKNLDNHKSGDYKSFENNVQVELADKVEFVKNMIDSKNETVRGLK